jgi:predicted DNA-binding transcriptional regulator AlpA
LTDYSARGSLAQVRCVQWRDAKYGIRKFVAIKTRHFSEQFRIPDTGPRQFEGVHVGWPGFTNFQEPTDMHTKISKEPTILRRLQVQQRTGLSRSTLYQYIKDGAFPASVQLGPVRWAGSNRTSATGSPRG